MAHACLSLRATLGRVIRINEDLALSPTPRAACAPRVSDLRECAIVRSDDRPHASLSSREEASTVSSACNVGSGSLFRTPNAGIVFVRA